MEKEIIWSPQAQKDFDRVLEYLESEWSENEIVKFILATELYFKTSFDV